MYLIPDCNLPNLTAQIDKLNKRAKKLGVPAIELTAVPSDYRLYEVVTKSVYEDSLNDSAPYWVKAITSRHTPTGRILTHSEVTVTGEAPKYAGWTLIGVLSPLDTDAGAENVIRAVPGNEVPAEYRDRVGECDHCKIRRQRNETFVVRHDDGNTKAVGRQCLRDFLGHKNPNDLAAWAEILCQLESACKSSEDYDEFGQGRGVSSYSILAFLTVTAAIIRNKGWMSRGKVYEEGKGIATADWVNKYLNPSPYDPPEIKAWGKEIAATLLDFAEKATAALDWALELEDLSNDYLYNVNLVARAGYVTDKTAGIAASIIAAYERAAGLAAEKKARPESNHVGVVGKRLEMTLTVQKVIAIEGYYGTKGIHKMSDENGNDIVWFASGDNWLKEGETVKAKATVKEHGEYQNRKQTVVTRLSVVVRNPH